MLSISFRAAIAVLCVVSSLIAQSPTTQESGPAFRALGDSAEPREVDRVRSDLDSAATMRFMALMDADDAPAAAAPAALPPEVVAQIKKAYEDSIAQMQKQVDKLDPVKDKETRDQFVQAIEQTKQAMAQAIGQAPAPAAPVKNTKALKRPKVSGDLSLDQTLASLRQMILDNGGADALAKFKASPDYASAPRCAAAATAAMVENRALAAIAALIRAHELEPQDPTHLVNLSGVTARLAMPHHTLALTLAAEKSNKPIKAAFGLNGKAILLNNRGMALVQLDKLVDAEAALRAAVELDPTMAEARINLAHALYRQNDPKKRDEGIRYARWSKARSVIKSVDDAKAVPPDPKAEPEGEVKKPEQVEQTLVRERGGRPPASQVFDLSRGKNGGLLTIKIPRTIGDGAGMRDKVQKLHEKLLAESDSVNQKMNKLWDQMRDRERNGAMSPIAAERARDIYWYIAHADSDPALRALFMDQWKAANDIGVGTFGGQLNNPWASHELQKKQDAIIAASQSHRATCEQMVAATEPYHLSWLGPMKNYENAVAKYYRARYRFQTALAANLFDPVHHEYAKLLIRHQSIGLTCEFLAPLMTVTNHDWHFATGWGEGIVKIEGGEDATDEEDEEADMCPAHLKGEYKVKVEIPFLEISGNCEKVGAEVSVGEWVKAFAEVEYTFEGQITVFIGGAGEASAPGVPVSAGAKAGAYITITNEGEFVDAGFKTTTVSGVGADIGPIGVGYEREIENTYSIVAAFAD